MVRTEERALTIEPRSWARARLSDAQQRSTALRSIVFRRLRGRGCSTRAREFVEPFILEVRRRLRGRRKSRCCCFLLSPPHTIFFSPRKENRERKERGAERLVHR